MDIPLLPFALTAIAVTFALAIAGWWVAERLQRSRRTKRRIAATDGSSPTRNQATRNRTVRHRR